MKLMKVLGFALVMSFASSAQALLLSPGGEYTSETFYPAYNNPDAADVSAIVGYTVDELYRNNVGGLEEGSFASSYDVTYTNTPADPSDALVTYVGGAVMSGAEWLVVKDGNQNPSWYLFDISSWDGLEDIQLSNFWPAQGAISHIAFFGGEASVPAPGALALMGLGLVGLMAARRRKA